jgi:hypothetical protein
LATNTVLLNTSATVPLVEFLGIQRSKVDVLPCSGWKKMVPNKPRMKVENITRMKVQRVATRKVVEMSDFLVF